MSIKQCIRDFLLEREIRRIGERIKVAYVIGDRASLNALWLAMAVAISRRSSSQVARMERRMGGFRG